MAKLKGITTPKVRSRNQFELPFCCWEHKCYNHFIELWNFLILLNTHITLPTIPLVLIIQRYIKAYSPINTCTRYSQQCWCGRYTHAQCPSQSHDMGTMCSVSCKIALITFKKLKEILTLKMEKSSVCFQGKGCD